MYGCAYAREWVCARVWVMHVHVQGMRAHKQRVWRACSSVTKLGTEGAKIRLIVKRFGSATGEGVENEKTQV